MPNSPVSPQIVFAGTPEFAVPTLDRLLANNYSVCAVYTQPDRPAGRGRRLQSSPVKQRALAAAIPVYQPRSLRQPATQTELTALQPDLLVVVAYGLLLPQAVLDTPRLGCINVHASLLPRWRGAAPIQRALLAGDHETGISLMSMDTGLDTGPVYAQVRCPIDAEMTAGELHDHLAELGAKALLKRLPNILARKLQAQPQPAAGACYAAKLEKSEAMLDWNLPATVLARQVQAFNPWPIAQTRWSDTVLRIWRARAHPEAISTSPGRVVRETRDGIFVAAGSGQLQLTELQLPGKRPLLVTDFVNAHSLLGQHLQ